MNETAVVPLDTEKGQQGGGTKPDRMAFIDVAKGIGILAIVALHSSNRSSRIFATQGDVQWWTLTVLNRLLAFAVPMFFFISAFLWAKSQARKRTPTDGTWKRFAAILYPYVIWTCLFLIFRITVERGPNEDLRGVLSPHNLFVDFLWGKGYFHLYFLSVLLQAALLFPLMYLTVRRTGFVGVCALSWALQALVFWSQTRWQYIPFVGSTVLWYITSLLPGAWLGAHWPIGSSNLRRLVIPSATLTVIGDGLYLWLQVREVHKDLSWSGVTNYALQVFVFGAGLLLIAGLALRESRSAATKSKAKAWLMWLGATSLPFYLIHPIVMRFTSGPRITSALARIPLAPLWVYGLVLIGTFGLLLVLRVARAERVLFGRISPRIPNHKDL